MKTELLYDIKAKLGEGPVWDARAQTIYWLDILNKRVYAEGDVFLQLDDLVGCIAPRKSGGLILALSNTEEGRLSFSTTEADSTQLTLLSSLSDVPPNYRFNDGKCDPRGRFLAGTMILTEDTPVGSLYSFDGSSTTTLLNNLTIPNGLTWSPDYKTFYYIDTPTREVKAFDYDHRNGSHRKSTSCGVLCLNPLAGPTA